MSRLGLILSFLISAGPWLLPASSSQAAEPGVHLAPALAPTVRSMVKGYCQACHDGEEAEAGLNVTPLLAAPIDGHRETWEKIVRRLRARQMPPTGADRPDEATYEQMLTSLESALDRIATESPRPGRTETFRRLTRTEYRNAIRDLLHLDVDVNALLPADESSHGFDNVTVGDLSPTLLNRYVTAARKIARLAVGRTTRSPDAKTFRAPPDRTQEAHVEGLPIGTRGGLVIDHTFPRDGDYEVRVRLARDRNEHVEGLQRPHQLDVLLDSKRIGRFTVKPPRGGGNGQNAYDKPTHDNVDRHLKLRFPASAGPHRLGVTFLKQSSSLLETRRQPLNVHFNMYRHPRLGPAVYQVSITGPFQSNGVGDTPSRLRIFICKPSDRLSEDDCARRIVATLLRRARRRPIVEADLSRPMKLYHEAKANGGFEAGIEMALAAILVNPQFLFRVERDPADLPPGEVYEVDDLALASRLSFFLWSSIPDDELLEVAERGRLRDPVVLTQQARRMLKDPRAQALATNFAGQWLYLRNLESFTPDARLYPDFDDNLRRALRRETELYFESIVRENKSVLKLLKSDYTFLNERLAKHYGIPHVYGSRFRRVVLPKGVRGGGLLRHGSVLTVTSYANRTSPVLRGKWILENLLGTPPPPPPDDVPALEDNTVAANLSVRERLAQHRANPACATCHDLIDPVGFALEHFDAVGRWRSLEGDSPIDASGGLPDGQRFYGINGLERGLLERPEIFVGAMCEKLLTYALGRGVGHHDAPAVRKIVQEAKREDYRIHAILVGIVTSAPFRMRTAQ